MVGLGWDQAERAKKGFLGIKFNVDCDASVILCGSDGKALPGGDKKSCISFANKVNGNRSIVHQGDNLNGKGEGDDEQINLKLDEIPQDIEKLVFIVNIFMASVKKQHFGLVENAFIRLVDIDTDQEICRFDLTENYDGMTGMILGEVYRKNNSWEFNSIGQGVKEASYVSDILKLYN